ncbi:MAG: hydrogen peroxide-inducible genes activator [Gammaproteobacteria bacterium]|nr:hydrogen peroxide-inducible genes activator [Gammaproteobacteria bacterium]
MTLTELRYIVAVADAGHFGRAAQRCFVSQPTLSIGVKKLEDELGVQLFERDVRSVTVTEIGEAVVAQARQVLEQAERVKILASQGRDQLVGPLRVAAIYTVGPYLYPDLIPRLKKRAPRMPLIVQEGYTAEVAQHLKQNAIDAAILALPFAERGIDTVPLYEEPFVLVSPSGHPINQKKQIRAQALAGEDLILLGPGHCFRQQVLDTCPGCIPAHTPQQGRFDGGSLETIRHMVASGFGITVLPCTAAGVDKYSRRLLSVRRFDGKPPTRTVALAYRKSFPRPRAIETLHAAIHDCSLTCVTHLPPAALTLN